MTKTAHIISNGPSAGFYKPAKGLKILCKYTGFFKHKQHANETNQIWNISPNEKMQFPKFPF